eukprot:1393013-Heterocapsa_arctica.AAC.1
MTKPVSVVAAAQQATTSATRALDLFAKIEKMARTMTAAASPCPRPSGRSPSPRKTPGLCSR